MTTNEQLELGFNGTPARIFGRRREKRVARAKWWFAKMRAAVEGAMDWQTASHAAPGTNLDARREPRSEDLSLARNPRGSAVSPARRLFVHNRITGAHKVADDGHFLRAVNGVFLREFVPVHVQAGGLAAGGLAVAHSAKGSSGSNWPCVISRRC